MPNSEIMSMEGQLVGMPLAGPESFSQQQLDYLKRALGVDETVLWESAAGEDIAVNKEFNLSEAYTNFSKIRVSAVRAPASGNTLVENTFEVSATLNVICWPGLLLHASNKEVYVDIFRATLSGSKMTINTFERKTLTTSGVISGGTSYPVTVFKVVGIHRIAGGN